MSTETVVSSNTDGFKEPSVFKIQVDAEFYHLISGGLYSNPIKAIVREYSTNAMDSHILAGNKEPFEVHVPSNKELYFYVRDFGVGLTEKEMDETWNTYFKSTKRDDDSQTGFFGLGSKAAISIYSSFTVISYKDGRMIRGLVQLNKDKIPQLLLEAKPHPTDEPNGLKVYIPVAASDVVSFQQSAAEIYRYFPTAPKFVGDFVLSIFGEMYSDCIHLDNDVLIRKIAEPRHIHPGVIFGGIKYPVHEKEVCNFDVCVPAGLFHPTPSREAIQWDKQAIRNYTDIVRQLWSKLRQKLEGIVEDVRLSDAQRVDKLNNFAGYESRMVTGGMALHCNSLIERILSKYNVKMSDVELWRSSNHEMFIRADRGGCITKGKNSYVIKRGYFRIRTNKCVIVDLDVRNWRSCFHAMPDCYVEQATVVLDEYSEQLLTVLPEYGITPRLIKLSEAAASAGIKVVRLRAKADGSPKVVNGGMRKCVGCFVPKKGSMYLIPSAFAPTTDISAAEYFIVLDSSKKYHTDASNYQPSSSMEFDCANRELMDVLGIDVDSGKVIGIKKDYVHLYPHLKSLNQLILEKRRDWDICPYIAVRAIEDHCHKLHNGRRSFPKFLNTLLKYIHELSSVKLSGTTKYRDNPLVDFLLSRAIHKCDSKMSYVLSFIRYVYTPNEKKVHRQVCRIMSKWNQVLRKCPHLYCDYKELVEVSIRDINYFIEKTEYDYKNYITNH